MTRLLTPSTEVEIKNGLTFAWHVVIGVLAMAAGSAGVWWVLTHETNGHPDHVLIFFFGGIAIVGALILPSIFTAVKPIILFVFPNGIPMLGGRRVNDPPVPPTTGGQG